MLAPLFRIKYPPFKKNLREMESFSAVLVAKLLGTARRFANGQRGPVTRPHASPGRRRDREWREVWSLKDRRRIEGMSFPKTSRAGSEGLYVTEKDVAL